MAPHHDGYLSDCLAGVQQLKPVSSIVSRSRWLAQQQLFHSNATYLLQSPGTPRQRRACGPWPCTGQQSPATAVEQTQTVQQQQQLAVAIGCEQRCVPKAVTNCTCTRACRQTGKACGVPAQHQLTCVASCRVLPPVVVLLLQLTC
jgi:hypothetical protein